MKKMNKNLEEVSMSRCFKVEPDFYSFVDLVFQFCAVVLSLGLPWHDKIWCLFVHQTNLLSKVEIGKVKETVNIDQLIL